MIKNMFFLMVGYMFESQKKGYIFKSKKIGYVTSLYL
jgi:hypothetical protein